MRQAKLGALLVFFLGAAFLGASSLACDGADPQALAEEICSKQIECEIQLLDQNECTDTYVELLDEETLESCKACQEGKSCEDLSGGACVDSCF